MLVGSGSGAITRSTKADKYIKGSTVKLTARPVEGSKFLGWHGDARGHDITYTITMDSIKSVSAEFVALETFSLAIASMGTGTGEIERSLVAAQYVEGAKVTLTARAGAGSKFKCWHGDANGRSGTCEMTMDSSKKVAAEFVVLESYPLDVTATGTGRGSIDRSIDSPSYFAGAKVTLTALAEEGSVFNGWHGDVTMMQESIIVTMTSAFSISAEFVVLESFPLDVIATGTGRGSIDRSIDSSSYLAGTKVTLTALAEEGSIFNGWHGDVTMMDDSIVVTMTSAFSISAEFIQLLIADTEITAELVSTTRSEVKRGLMATVFRLMLRSNSEQQVRIKVPLTSYVRQSGQTSEQSSWAVGLVNGSKGVTLSAGTFCEIGLVHSTRPAKGDRLYVNVEQIQPSARLFFVFQCTGGWDDFLLISASLGNLGQAPSTKATYPAMASALRRIESLEGTLAEVLRRLDAIQRESPIAGLNSPSNQTGPVQTLSEILAWMAEHERVGVAELRVRLLPLDLLPSAVIEELNERALDLTGELAVEEVGDLILVKRDTLREVLANGEAGPS